MLERGYEMKIETREMTSVCKVYVSDDGRSFISEYDCIDYEFKQIAKSLKMYNRKCDRTSDVFSVLFFKSENKEDNRKFIKLCEHEHMNCVGIDVKKVGLYVCSSFDGGFLYMPDVLLKLSKKDDIKI